jgi:hypothetical protein
MATTATAIINSIRVKPPHRDARTTALRDPIPRRTISGRAPPMHNCKGDNIARRLVLCDIDMKGPVILLATPISQDLCRMPELPA